MREFIDSQLEQSRSAADVKAFFSNVYAYMFMALSITGIVSWYMASSGLFIKLFLNTETGAISPMFYVVVFSPLALVLLIQSRYHKFSMTNLLLLYILYAVLLGASLTTIFFAYSIGELATTFLVTAGAFGAMALLGYTTSVDLSKMGSLLYMAFIGIFIAAIVNMFLGSEPLAYLISIIGVFVFTGLTAWEMQKLKAVATSPEIEGEERSKRALMGGLMLYILFVNLFLSLLHLLGGRD